MEGGFLGVDVFFVISGYLITSIIEPKISSGTFSFKAFYLKRVRRLVPPALVTIVATFIAACFILQPNDLIGMAKSAIAASFSVSNILFFTEAGYWDIESELKPLLHTWSLGVEEQFYLLWPFLVFCLSAWFGRKSRSINWVVIFGIISIVGLAVSHLMLQWNAAGAFYLLPARVFEFAIGAFFAFFGRAKFWQNLSVTILPKILGLIGLSGLTALIFIYDGSTAFPGINGIIPSVLTGFVLLSGARPQNRGAVTALLSFSPFVWIGQLSYSLYLVHWPVVSLMRYKVGLELSFIHQLFAIGLTVILTLALYYGVEKLMSSRKGQGGTGRRRRILDGTFAMRTGVTALIASLIFGHAIFNSGWTWRFPALVITPVMINAGTGGRTSPGSRDCTFIKYSRGPYCDPQRSIRVLVVGDSHEREGVNIMRAAYGDSPELELIRYEIMFSCELSKREGDGARSKDEFCRERNKKFLESDTLDEIDTIFYSANQPFEEVETFTLDMIRKAKRRNPHIKIMTMGSFIVTKKPCPQLINEFGRYEACVASENIAKWAGTDKDQILYDDFLDVSDLMINRMELLCSGETPESCESQAKGGGLALIDTNHMSIGFTDLTADRLHDKYPDLLNWMDGPAGNDHDSGAQPLDTPFDPSLFASDFYGNPVKDTQTIKVTREGIAFNSTEGTAGSVLFKEVVTAVAGKSFEAKMVFELLETGTGTNPMILVWPLNSEGVPIDGRAFTPAFAPAYATSKGRKSITMIFDTVEGGSGDVLLKRADEAVAFQFALSPIHASDGAKAILKHFEVKVIDP